MPDSSYTTEISPAAHRSLGKLSGNTQRQIAARIDALANDPRPSGVKKLEGEDPPLYRIRAGDYRIVYSIDDAHRKVSVYLIGDRKEVYKRGLS
jgi:mRNA interferase RelE/StbE